MNKMKMLNAVVTTYILLLSTAQAATTQPVFTPEQEARIGEIAADYLVAHPEVLVTVSQKLQAQQQAKQQMAFAVKVMENQAALLNDKDTPVVGAADAKVAVIEFFDYQCVYCSKLAPEIEKVMKDRTDVRYIFKEWPIFASRWDNSQKAAEKGLSVWKTAGADAYMKYHNGVYKTGHIEGDLTEADIKQAAAQALKGHSGPVAEANFQSSLDKTNNLAQALGLTGTPGLIVMPTGEATPDKITVLPGAVPAEQILAAIKKASQ
jgi:protein-disulfide isomerase